MSGVPTQPRRLPPQAAFQPLQERRAFGQESLRASGQRREREAAVGAAAVQAFRQAAQPGAADMAAAHNRPCSRRRAQHKSNPHAHLCLGIGAQPAPRPCQLEAAGRHIQGSRAAGIFPLTQALAPCRRLRASAEFAATLRRCCRGFHAGVLPLPPAA